MFRLVSIIGLILGLTACGTTNKVSFNQPQYCYIDKTMTEQTSNGQSVINEYKKTVCSDNPAKKVYKAQLGISNNCREYWYKFQGQYRAGLVCEKPEGGNGTSWEIVPYPF